ncbi:MAG: hypothetical protein HYV07_32160 [Deltaproteobacteria bacterium]|nr:hypothetical protein [Deltaproteobacteria bacterium]
MNKKSILSIVAALVLAAAGFLFAYSRASAPRAELAPAVTPDAGTAGPSIPMVSAEERAEYLKQQVSIAELAASEDSFTDATGQVRAVPGLLAVTGEIENKGAKGIKDIVLTIYPENDKGEVIASYQHDVTLGKVLKPGEKREFRFTIPSRGGMSAKLRHKLD